MGKRILPSGVVLWGAAAVAIALTAGCTSNPVRPVPRGSESAGPEATATAAPPPPVLEPVSIPVGLPCDQLVTPDQMIQYSPDVSLDPAYAATGTAARIVEWQGVACGWVNAASGATIEIAVAHLSPPDIEAKKNELVLTTPAVPTYGGVDYFANDGQVGEANAFAGEYWILARSPVFFEPGDAAMLIEDVKGAVG